MHIWLLGQRMELLVERLMVMDQLGVEDLVPQEAMALLSAVPFCQAARGHIAGVGPAVGADDTGQQLLA